ncbi:hypothetical protein GCM10025792_16130 [Pseudonocardia tropica]
MELRFGATGLELHECGIPAAQDVRPVRWDSAPMVLVGLTAAPVVRVLPSQTNRFGTSQVWHHSSSTESPGWLPIRQVPMRCQAGGGWSTPVSLVSTAPTARVASKILPMPYSASATSFGCSS